jgi:3-oxoacyl-[acyl-carrier protein] reductase
MNRTVLITGASRGIGRAIALAFAQEGYNLVLNYHKNEAAALELKEQLKKKHLAVQVFQADVSVRRQVAEMVRQTHELYGRIDVLVNNAGIAQTKLFTDITERDWNRMFDINIKGMFHCAQEVLPQMIHDRRGRIINISSIWGVVGASCEVHYSAAKAAVIGFTKALAKEVGPSGICVNCVAPGVIKTDMLSGYSEDELEMLREEVPLQRLGTPEDIARAVLYLASEDAGFMTGQVLSPNGGMVV